MLLIYKVVRMQIAADKVSFWSETCTFFVAPRSWKSFVDIELGNLMAEELVGYLSIIEKFTFT